MTTNDDLLPGPTGLDYLAAYEALYPGLAAEGRKVHQLPDDRLKLVDRAARMRRAERDRVKAGFLALATEFETEQPGDHPLLKGIAHRIQRIAEETR